MKYTDTELLEMGFSNTLNIILGVVDINELLLEAFNKKEVLILAHDPNMPINDEVIDRCIRYYESVEDYELCQVLLDYKGVSF